VRDDVPLIVGNALMRSPGGLGRLVSGDFLASTGFTSGLWRPLPLASFWIEGRVGGWEPALFHATSVLLHAGAALLTGLLLTQAGIPRIAATLGALWFATMPAHLEAAAWISGRTDLLSGGFALLSLWLDRRARRAGRAWPGGMALAAFAGALLSKESAAGWVVIILVVEWVRTREVLTGRREILRWVAPYVAITAFWLAAHAAASGPAALPGYVDEALRARRQAAGWVMLPQYLAFLWPWFPHASDVALALPARPLDGTVIGGALLTLLAGAIALGLAFRRSRLAVPAAIILVPIVPSIAAAVGLGFVSSGERMMFLASAGVAWIAAAGLAWAWERGTGARWSAGLLAVALVAGSAVETARLQPMWASDESVFRGMTERQPGNPVGWVGLGETLTRAGRRDDAERALARAAQLGPDLPAAHAARAELHYRFGEWERLLPPAGRALELDPMLFPVRLLRASTLLRLGRPGEAAPDIEWLMRERPGDPAVLIVAGQRHMAEGRPEAAIAPFTAALERQALDPALWAALGFARAAVGDLPAARTAIERSLEIEPRAPAVWRRLAAVCAAMGDSAAEGAARDRERSLVTPPGGSAP
jgi:predicted Zn-dependent protease